MNPREAYEYAVKYGPSEETREIACEDVGYAYWYAREIDKKPREDTRNAACRSPHFAYYYAKNIDKGRREDTRKATCGNPLCAYRYAQEVDKGFHGDTWHVVQNTKYEEDYKKFFIILMKEDII